MERSRGVVEERRSATRNARPTAWTERGAAEERTQAPR